MSPYYNGVSVTFKRKSTASIAIIYANKTSIEQLEQTTALKGRYETIDAYVCT